MAIINHTIEAADYQQQNILISELSPQPNDLSAEQLQARFDALGLLIISKFNDLVADLSNAFTAAGVSNSMLAESTNPTATNVAEQLAYLLYRVNHVGEGSGVLPPVDGVTDAYLSGLAGNIKQRFTDHTTGTTAQHTVAQLPTGTTAATVALGNHVHSYAPVSHSHAAGDISTGTVDVARLPTGSTSTTVSKGDHIHDDRYYTESEVSTFLGGKSNTGHTHAGTDVNSGLIPAAQIPSLAVSKISGLRDALDSLQGQINTKQNAANYMWSVDGHSLYAQWNGSNIIFYIDGVVTKEYSITAHDHGNSYVKAGYGWDFTIYYGDEPPHYDGTIWLKPIN